MFCPISADHDDANIFMLVLVYQRDCSDSDCQGGGSNVLECDRDGHENYDQNNDISINDDNYSADSNNDDNVSLYST